MPSSDTPSKQNYNPVKRNNTGCGLKTNTGCGLKTML